MFSRFFRWIDERWPLSPFIRLALEEEMSGGSSYAYVFGSAALIIFLLQALTGIWQLFYYVPTLSQGYNSLNYLRTEVPFGWLVHGFHYWGANAMVVCVMLHLSQVFIWGAYKRPHELQWVTGVFLFLLTMAMSLTGGALPWDKRSYWLVEVASSAAGTVPVIGELIKRIMLGGGVIGQLTLSRFFVLHAALVSGALFTLAAIHLVALRKVGNAGPWDDEERQKKGPFWPDQVFKDGLVAGLIILLLVALSVFVPPPFAGMADPLDASYIPKPEWNFLFFYQALKFFPGRLEVIATMGIPLVGTLVLLLIPFRGPRPGASPRPATHRHGGLGCRRGAVHRPHAGRGLQQARGARGDGAQAAQSSPPARLRPHRRRPRPEKRRGGDLFKSQGCAVCHRIGATGGNIGPDLSGEGLKGRSREWLSDQLRNPKAHNPSSVMPSFAALGQEKIGQLVDYLLSLKEEKPATASRVRVRAFGRCRRTGAGCRGSRRSPRGAGYGRHHHRQRRSWRHSLREYLHLLPRSPRDGQGPESRFDGRNDSVIEPDRPGRIQPRPEELRRKDRPLHPARFAPGRTEPASSACSPSGTPMPLRSSRLPTSKPTSSA